MAKIYYEKDADLGILKGKKICCVGYGIQGRAQSLCLKDSGANIVIGLIKDPTWNQAVKDGMNVKPVADAVKGADIVMMLIPDQLQKMVYEKDVAPNLKKGAAIDFAHGFNIVFKRIIPPKDSDVIMVAPKGPGKLVRSTFEEGFGVPALVAIEQNASGKALQIALAIAKALGATRAGVIQTTFKEETETDLFGEQVDLCGGCSEMIKKSFEVLVEAGYQPEIAYFEVLHELKLIVDLIQAGGVEGMWRNVSNTAEYGGRTRGPVIMDDSVKEKMRRALKDIQSGKFADEWMKEYEAGLPRLKKLREEGTKEQIEVVGADIRRMFSKK
ncbi:MAG: ketol-acid reductoisomerase [Thermoplasmata archaeon]|nr:ketol-acid reductoisomerase [Thermoplasmata archaeon]